MTHVLFLKRNNLAWGCNAVSVEVCRGSSNLGVAALQGWGPGIAGGIIAGALIGGLASSTYGYGPGYGYYGPGYYGGEAPVYYGGYGPTYYGGYGHPYYGGYRYNRFKNWGG